MIIKDTFEGVIKQLDTWINTSECGFLCGIHQKTLLSVGKEGYVNDIACEVLKIPTWYYPREGGPILFSRNDFAIVAIRPSNEHFNTRLNDYLIEKLKEKGINACNKDNDILIDGKYKVAGCAKIRLVDGRNLSFMHVSITDNKWRAKFCSTKPSWKIPSGLSNWDIKSWQVEEWVLNFIKENYKDEELVINDTFKGDL